MGVSPHANIFALKVLGSDGSGSSSDIITAMDYVVTYSRQQRGGNHRSVISMSLGGPCDDDDCSSDSIVLAVENVIRQGILVSVAAGNEGCNACYGSPNAAPNAITGTFVGPFRSL